MIKRSAAVTLGSPKTLLLMGAGQRVLSPKTPPCVKDANEETIAGGKHLRGEWKALRRDKWVSSIQNHGSSSTCCLPLPDFYHALRVNESDHSSVHLQG